MKKWVLRVLAVAIGLPLCAVLLGWIFFARLAVWALYPKQPFAAQTPPKAPDYREPAMWSALPDRDDAADARLPSLPPIDPSQTAVDVFYIHPTSYVGPNWNGPVDDARLNADTDRVATRIQASAFSGCCAVYAPRYRQANGMAFSHPSVDGDQAIRLAYRDVEQAFLAFLARRPQAPAGDRPRPFFIAAHSQGSALGYRLLREQIHGRPLRAGLVAAYLIGAQITRASVVQDLPDIPVCATALQTGCVVGWNARGSTYQPSPFEMKRLQDRGQDEGALRRDRICVNPLSFATDAQPAAADRNAGALFFDAKDPAVLPGFASAQCLDGTLVVGVQGAVPRDFMSRLLDHVLGVGNYHPIEYQLFFVPLRENAKARADAFIQHATPKAGDAASAGAASVGESGAPR